VLLVALDVMDFWVELVLLDGLDALDLKESQALQ
jgi:hypothetical protein